MTAFYMVLFSLQLLGGLGLYWANRNKSKVDRQKIGLKYWVYQAIIILMFGMMYLEWRYWSFLIVGFGVFELCRAILHAKISMVNIVHLLVFLFLSTYFIRFSLEGSSSYLMLSYLGVIVMDGFSQVSGQLFGKRALLPKISPNKTWAGLIGGILAVMLTMLIIINDTFLAIGFGTSIALLSFTGDIAASAVKRYYGIKDFSQVLPGQGGFLDRFDSFIVVGAINSLFPFFEKII